jgi:S1-C subfamily serine protease
MLVGFKNFPMDDFGVTSRELKLRAERPSMPEPVLAESSGHAEIPRELLGMTVKSVETRGEQSATGLASMEGALVLAVVTNSPAGGAGLIQGDVILRILDDTYGQSDTIATAADLVSAYQGRRWRGEIEFEVWRNQARTAVKVTFQ